MRYSDKPFVLPGDARAVDGSRYAVLLPGFGFRDLGANVERQQRGNSAYPEHGAPAEIRQHQSRGHCGQQVTDGIAALENSGEHAAPAHRSVFHDQRCSHAPLAAHANAEQHSQDQKHGEVGREAAQHLDGRKEYYVDHQRTAPAITVGHHAEEQRADGPHGQRGGDAEHDVALGNVEVGGQRVEEEDDDEEIEGIQRPAEKARGHGMPAIGVETGLGRLGPKFTHGSSENNREAGEEQ